MLSIGVNAVTPFYMAKLWREMLMPGSSMHGCLNSFIHPSLGYSRAPMMVLEDCDDYAANGTAPCDDCVFLIDWRDELANAEHPAKTKQEAIELAGENPVGFHWQARTESSCDFEGTEWNMHNASMR